ncbi:MAG: peptide chain release factor N(5)-glutamine methyltransferase [Pseudomonadota bacterium]|nr:peptide chain release factor N(5)-glutamine methyltransferase [Pseudomonadota bacterium]
MSCREAFVCAWSRAQHRLAAAGVETPVIDARLLLEAAAGASRAEIIADPRRTLTPEQSVVFDAYLARRVAREPVSRILGSKGFWNIMLKVTADVLTPRPETETILDVVLPCFAAERRFSILELGIGSGTILLALLSERPGAFGLGVDISEQALAVARQNAIDLGLASRLALLRADWTKGLSPGHFDLVVANPPYVAIADLAALEPEVRDHEPLVALNGGADGLDAYRSLAPQVLDALRPGGLFAVEIGAEQGDAVISLFGGLGAEDVRRVSDLAGRERVVAGKKSLGQCHTSG